MRYYSNTAVETTLTSGVSSSGTTIEVAATTGFPATTPFTLVLDADSMSEELVSVTSVGGLTLTVERGYDNTTEVSHSVGAVVRHVHSAADFADSRAHEAASANVHGVVGSVVGTSDTQTVSNKTFDGTNTFPSSLATDTELDAHASADSAHGVTGDVVGTSDTQTLTNKDLSSSTNTFATQMVRTVGYDSVATDIPYTSETLILSEGYPVVSGGVYRVTSYTYPAADTAGTFSTIRLKWSTSSSGTTGTEIQECIRDHRIANRREGVTAVASYTAAATTTHYAKVTMACTGGGGTNRGLNGPAFLFIERIA